MLRTPTTTPNIPANTAIPIIIPGTGDPVLVYNGDIENVLLISNQSAPVLGSSIPVQPLTGVTVTDAQKWWATPAPGGAGNGSVSLVTVAPGATQISPSPTQIAAQIELKGITVNLSQYTMTPSGDATGVTDFNTLNGLIGIAKLITMGPGTYTFNTNWPQLSIGQKIKGAGFGITVCNFLGSGDMVRFTQAGPYTGSKIGGGVNDMTLDGSAHAAGASAGLHAGDIESLDFDGLEIRNFNGAGDVGYHFDNTIFWTERLTGFMRSLNNATAYLFDVSGATTSTGSFARINAVLWYSSPVPTFNGVVLNNGANIYNMVCLTISGNHGSAGSGSSGNVLTVSGSVPVGHPGAGQGSRIQNGAFNIGVETSAGAVVPGTILFGAAGNVISGTVGMLSFGPGMAPTNLTAVGAVFRHDGQITGDVILAVFALRGAFNQLALPTGGTISNGISEIVYVNPAAAVTGIIIAPGGGDGQQLKVVNLSAFLITFAASGTSNVFLGAAATVPSGVPREFIWNAANALWYGGG